MSMNPAQSLPQYKELKLINLPKKLVTPTHFKKYMFQHNRYATTQHNSSLQYNNINNSSIAGMGSQDQTLNNSIAFNETPQKKYEDFHFTARNLRSICDNDFISGKTKLHSKQKFGQRKSLKKLIPLAKINNLQSPREIHRKKPRRKLENIDQRHFLRTKLNRYDYDMIITVYSFNVQLKSKSAEENGLEGGLISECEVNFSDADYLVQHTIGKIKLFFENYVVLENEDMLFLEFQRFSHIPAFKNDEDDIIIQDQEYPDSLSKLVETADDSKEIILQFPKIEFFVPELQHTQTYTITQNEFKDLIREDFQNIYHQVTKYFQYSQLKIAKNKKYGTSNQHLKLCRYTIDDIVEDFTVETQEGLSTFKDCFENKQKWVILVTMPETLNSKASQEELITLKSISQKIFEAKNTKIVVLSGDSLENHLQTLNKLKDEQECEIDFPIINDDHRQISQKWGAIDNLDNLNEAGLTVINKSLYIINPDMQLKYQSIGENTSPDVARTFEDLDQIFSGVYKSYH